MNTELFVSNVRFHGANQSAAAAGLIGFVEFTLNHGIRVTGVALRRTRAGRYTLSYPAPRQRALLAPIDDQSRVNIEEQVFKALGLTGSAR